MANKTTSVLLMVTCLTSCISTKRLYKDLTKKETTIEYLFDSKTSILEKIDTITVLKPVISDAQFTEAGRIVKKRASFIPLIIFTQWKKEHEYFAGSNIIAESIPEFIQNSVVQETNRSTVLFAQSDSPESRLSLEITVDEIGARGPHKSEDIVIFLVFFYVSTFTETAGPGMGYSRLTYRLKRDGETIFSGDAYHQVLTEPLTNRFKNPKDLRAFFAANLTEALSETLKANIEEITREVEEFIAKQ